MKHVTFQTCSGPCERSEPLVEAGKMSDYLCTLLEVISGQSLELRQG
jgi:hypothetical protein